MVRRTLPAWLDLDVFGPFENPDVKADSPAASSTEKGCSTRCALAHACPHPAGRPVAVVAVV